MRGCVAYDCFGAGQRVVALLGPARSPDVLRAYELVRQLHELLWYADDALSRPAAAPTHRALRTARTRIDHLITRLHPDTPPDPADPPDPPEPPDPPDPPDPADSTELVVAAGPAGAVEAVDPGEWRAMVAPLLRRASRLVRAPDRARADLAGADLAGADLAGADLAGADLVGRDLAGADLRRADLSAAYLIGADLRGADLRCADLLGADLRGADLAGADLAGALYLTRTQLGGARGSISTILADRLPHPAHWPATRPDPLPDAQRPE
jgi:hypothetical protein